jgi:hypothetical protein
MKKRKEKEKEKRKGRGEGGIEEVPVRLLLDAMFALPFAAQRQN